MQLNPYFFLLLFSVTVASFSQILLKKGAQKQYSSFLREYLNPYVILGYLMLFGSMVMTMIAFQGVSFLTVPVMEALGYVLVPLLSVFIFRERISGRKMLGMALILAGVFIANLPGA